MKRQKDKRQKTDQKESLVLRRQGSFALLRCFFVFSGEKKCIFWLFLVLVVFGFGVMVSPLGELWLWVGCEVGSIANIQNGR